MDNASKKYNATFAEQLLICIAEINNNYSFRLVVGNICSG